MIASIFGITDKQLEVINKSIDKTVPTATKRIYNAGVKCVTTGMIFKTVKEAAKYYNGNGSSISKCARGQTKYSGKLITGEKLTWEYAIEN